MKLQTPIQRLEQFQLHLIDNPKADPDLNNALLEMKLKLKILGGESNFFDSEHLDSQLGDDKVVLASEADNLEAVGDENDTKCILRCNDAVPVLNRNQYWTSIALSRMNFRR